MKRIIAACGNDCSACPRYVAHPYEKTQDELRHTAELWVRIGYRDHVVSMEEISCMGCKPENWCRYHVVKCCQNRGIQSCAECGDYPCANLNDCFRVTESFEPRCRQVCTEQEYDQLARNTSGKWSSRRQRSSGRLSIWRGCATLTARLQRS
ncbi:MAG: DUF3795 domain-containing protein [Clostridia bacterium]|nr:DUF3795 domain-containing protein [Clostridia bacterium]